MIASQRACRLTQMLRYTAKLRLARIASLLCLPVLFFLSGAAGALEGKSVAAGGQHTLSIKEDGSLWAAGGNSRGQLGDGTQSQRTRAVPVGGAGVWVGVSAGYEFSAGLRPDGSLWTWGDNQFGQLGLGATGGNVVFPERVGTSSGWRQVALGDYHAVALQTDGSLWAWGNNSVGQVGDGTFADRSLPVRIGTDTGWIAVAARGYHTLALKVDGTLWSWGFNDSGQLGLGHRATSPVPARVGAASNWVSISAGLGHSLGLTADGALWAWGENGSGQLGNGSTGDLLWPGQVFPAGVWTAASAGDLHSLAMRADGSLWAWGNNTRGQLGDGTLSQRLFPVLVNASGTLAWSQVAGGSVHSAAVDAEGNLKAWGHNGNGQLGDGTLTRRSSPVVVGNAKSRLRIAAGLWTAATLRNDGWLHDWGGSINDLPLPFDKYFSSMNLGRSRGGAGFGIKVDGSLWGWGTMFTEVWPGSGQCFEYLTTLWELPRELGNQVTSGNHWPTAAGRNWKSVTAGNSHQIALKSDGTLWTWGANCFGELGTGSTTHSTSPVRIGAAANWTSVSTGVFFSMARRGDGSIWGWGSNQFGQIGTGSAPANIFAPVQVGAAFKWREVWAGGYHAVAIRQDGSLWAWGNNHFGQLGDGTSVQRSTPVRIGADNTWISVSAGLYHTLAIKADGTLWSWGRNEDGELGIRTRSAPVATPTRVNIERDWVAVAAGEGFSVGLKADGTVWTWGRGKNGELGIRDMNQSSVPLKLDIGW